jgi:hypothetical protein
VNTFFAPYLRAFGRLVNTRPSLRLGQGECLAALNKKISAVLLNPKMLWQEPETVSKWEELKCPKSLTPEQVTSHITGTALGVRLCVALKHYRWAV